MQLEFLGAGYCVPRVYNTDPVPLDGCCFLRYSAEEVAT